MKNKKISIIVSVTLVIAILITISIVNSITNENKKKEAILQLSQNIVGKTFYDECYHDVELYDTLNNKIGDYDEGMESKFIFNDDNTITWSAEYKYHLIQRPAGKTPPITETYGYSIEYVENGDNDFLVIVLDNGERLDIHYDNESMEIEKIPSSITVGSGGKVIGPANFNELIDEILKEIDKLNDLENIRLGDRENLIELNIKYVGLPDSMKEQVTNYDKLLKSLQKCNDLKEATWINCSRCNGSKTEKCINCNGTGKVKYYYGSSDLEAVLSGHDPYSIGPCTMCDEKGYYSCQKCKGTGGHYPS